MRGIEKESETRRKSANRIRFFPDGGSRMMRCSNSHMANGKAFFREYTAKHTKTSDAFAPDGDKINRIWLAPVTLGRVSFHHYPHKIQNDSQWLSVTVCLSVLCSMPFN